jgi:hypothetical protein
MRAGIRTRARSHALTWNLVAPAPAASWLRAQSCQTASCGILIAAYGPGWHSEVVANAETCVMRRSSVCSERRRTARMPRHRGSSESLRVTHVFNADGPDRFDGACCALVTNSGSAAALACADCARCSHGSITSAGDSLSSEGARVVARSRHLGPCRAARAGKAAAHGDGESRGSHSEKSEKTLAAANF